MPSSWTIVQNAEEIGYVIVSTRVESLQVVEYGLAGGLPFSKQLPNAQKEVAHIHGTVARHKFIYPMALIYGVESPGKAEPTYWSNKVGITAKSDLPSVNKAVHQLRMYDVTIQDVTEERYRDTELILAFLSTLKECSVLKHKPTGGLPVGFNYVLELYGVDFILRVSPVEIFLNKADNHMIYDVVQDDQKKLLVALESVFNSITGD